MCKKQRNNSHTVDGRNPAPVEVGSSLHYLQGFITHPNGGCLGFLNHQQFEVFKSLGSKYRCQNKHCCFQSCITYSRRVWVEINHLNRMAFRWLITHLSVYVISGWVVINHATYISLTI